jgi:hypothetical protein
MEEASSMSTENPYAASLQAADGGDAFDDQAFERTLLASSVSSVNIVACLMTLMRLYYGLSSIYLFAMLFTVLPPGTGPLVFYQSALTALTAALYAYSAYLDWSYRKAILHFVRGSLSWRQFAATHSRFWRGGVLVGIAATVLTFVPWAIQLVWALR